MNDISYKKWESMPDGALLQVIGFFIQKNRLNKNKTQTQIAKEAGISRSTLSLLERGQNIRLDSLIQVLRVLDLLYIINIFKIEDQISPIEYAKIKKKQRKQASPTKEENKTNNDLGW